MEHQAANPTGFVGRLFGLSMEILNKSSNRAVADVAASLNPTKICEVGCGPGQLLEMLAERLPDCAIVGTDISDEMVASAKRRTRCFGARVTVEKLGAEDLPSAGIGGLSLICAVHSFQFWKSPETLVPELKKLLAPDGHVLLCLRLHSGGSRGGDLTNRVSKADDQPAAIAALFEAAGFTARPQISEKILLFGVS